MQPIDMIEVSPGHFAPGVLKQPPVLDRLPIYALHLSIIVSAVATLMAVDKWMGH